MWRLELILCIGLCFILATHGQEEDCGSPDGNCNKVNIALGKPANQTSTYSDAFSAILAVDGNTTSCAHTSGSDDEDTDSWEVDLENDYTITDITVYHAEGGHYMNPHSQRIAGVWVYVDDSLCYKFPDSLSIGIEPVERSDITCQRPIKGRLVRFVKNGFIHAKHYSFINFCEVQIWACKPGLYGPQCDKECNSHCQQGMCDNYDGTCNIGMENSTTESPPCDSPDGNCNKVNVALRKSTSMSPRYSDPGYISGPASLAVDGNTSTDYTSCVHTMGDLDRGQDWWQVDLGRNYTVTDITVYHREGGPDSNPHSQRIAGVWIYVDDTLCYKFPNSYGIGRERKEKDDITCQQPIRGQIVKFTKEGRTHVRHYTFINFCEVQIWVCRSGLYGPNCDEECSSHCQQGLCDNYDGTCETGCSEGYFGADCSEQCGQCQRQQTCDRVTGRCPHGCQPDYQPPECQLQLKRSVQNSSCDSPDRNCNKVNVALGKPANMSAPYDVPGYTVSNVASLAVDGNTSSVSASCVHTLGDLDSESDWWQVDLGRNYTVTEITVYHRGGPEFAYSHFQRISGVWIYVDDTLCFKFPDSRDIGYDERQKDDITCYRPIKGRIVRFAKDGRIHARHYSFINFCEVQIWVCRSGLHGENCEKQCNSHCQQGLCDNYDGTCDVGCSEGYYGADCSEQCGQCQRQQTCDRVTGRCPHGCQPDYQPPDCQLLQSTTTTESSSCAFPDGNCNKVNVALGKIASMSAPYEQPGYGSGPASLAVDGNTSTYYTNCVHTMGDLDRKQDWWQVDLGRNYTVTDITVYHREGGHAPHPFSQRIAGIWVYVDGTLCYKFPSSLNVSRSPKERDDITCERPIRGQIVKFSKEGFIHGQHYSFINFCEVQIWVCRSGLYGYQCQKQCNSHCQQGLCDNYDGTCDIGCSEGYYGADCSEQCGQCQRQQTCDRVTGRCPHGCQPDYQPPDCQLPVRTTSTPVPTTSTTTQPTSTFVSTLSPVKSSSIASSTSVPTTSTTAQPTNTFVSTLSPVKSSSIASAVPTSTSLSATTEGGGKDGDSLNRHTSNVPSQSDARRQHNTSKNSGSSNKKYSQGDMAGVAVSMIVLGAILGATGLALYRRFFGRRHTGDSMAFQLMQSSASEI